MANLTFSIAAGGFTSTEISNNWTTAISDSGQASNRIIANEYLPSGNHNGLVNGFASYNTPFDITSTAASFSIAGSVNLNGLVATGPTLTARANYAQGFAISLHNNSSPVIGAGDNSYGIRSVTPSLVIQFNPPNNQISIRRSGAFNDDTVTTVTNGNLIGQVFFWIDLVAGTNHTLNVFIANTNSKPSTADFTRSLTTYLSGQGGLHGHLGNQARVAISAQSNFVGAASTSNKPFRFQTLSVTTSDGATSVSLAVTSSSSASSSFALTVARELAVSSSSTSSSTSTLTVAKPAQLETNSASSTQFDVEVSRLLEIDTTIASSSSFELEVEKQLEFETIADSSSSVALDVSKALDLELESITSSSFDVEVSRPLAFDASIVSESTFALEVSKELALEVESGGESESDLEVAKDLQLEVSATSEFNVDIALSASLSLAATATTIGLFSITVGRDLALESEANSDAGFDLTVSKALAFESDANSSFSADLFTADPVLLAVSIVAESVIELNLQIGRTIDLSSESVSASAFDLTVAKQLAIVSTSLSTTELSLNAGKLLAIGIQSNSQSSFRLGTVFEVSFAVQAFSSFTVEFLGAIALGMLSSSTSAFSAELNLIDSSRYLSESERQTLSIVLGYYQEIPDQLNEPIPSVYMVKIRSLLDKLAQAEAEKAQCRRRTHVSTLDGMSVNYSRSVNSIALREYEIAKQLSSLLGVEISSQSYLTDLSLV